MAHEKLIAKLRNRATAYAPQQQTEVMLEAAAVIEKLSRENGTSAMLDALKRLDLDCDYCAHRDVLGRFPDCSGDCMECSHTDCRCHDCRNNSKWAWERGVSGATG